MAPEIYVLYRQVPYWSERMTLVARAHAGTDASPLVQSLRSELRALDQTLAADFALLEGTLDGLVAERRFVLAVLAGFAALALTLAAVGLYGLISFSVASQIREIGVRAALGARRSGILTLMMMRALRVAVLGAFAGFVAAFWLARTIESLLIDVPARDPASFAGAGIALLLVALLAAAVPAARASRVDPLVALRAE